MLTRLYQVPRHTRLSWLWPAFALVVAMAFSIQYPEDRAALAHAALIDTTLTTILISFLFTPKAQRTLKEPLTIALRGVALTALAFPEMRQYLWLELLGLTVSAAYLLRGLRTPLPAGFNDLDDLERTYAFWTRLTRSPRMLRSVLFEWTLLKHLFFRPKLPEGTHFGTRYGATTGSLLTLLIFGSVVEGMLSHVLLERWNHLAAWIWTGLNAFGLVWLLAYGRALNTRPITITHRRLYLRSGLHWTGSTPTANVRHIQPYHKEDDADAVNIAVDVKPNLTLEFITPVQLHGIYLTERQPTKIALHVDDPKAFTAALKPE